MAWTTVEQLATWNGSTLCQRVAPLSTCTGILEVSNPEHSTSHECFTERMHVLCQINILH